MTDAHHKGEHNNNNNKGNDSNWLDPHQSRPPPSIDAAAVAAASSWQQSRHACIHAIRQRQDANLPDDARVHGNNNKKNDATTTTTSIAVVRDAIRAASRILLVDPAYHANVGDHMISVAEQVYVQRHKMPHGAYYAECSYYQAGPWAPPCDKVLQSVAADGGGDGGGSSSSASLDRPSSVALWHGGGNWGDLWDEIHDRRTRSMGFLLSRNFTVIGMPQSLYFRDPHVAAANAREFRRAVAAGLGLLDTDNDGNGKDVANNDNLLQERLQSRLILTWREQESLDQAQKLYPYVQHTLMPDIAFQLGPYDATALRPAMGGPRRVDILFFLRADVESVYQGVRDRESIRKLLQSHKDPQKTAHLSYSIVDWPDRLDRFESKDYYFTETAVQLLDAGKVVICDRLHAAILAYLSGIPFVFVDQVSGKITKSFAVAMDSHKVCREEPAMWERAVSMEDAIDKAVLLWEKIQ